MNLPTTHQVSGSLVVAAAVSHSKNTRRNRPLELLPQHQPMITIDSLPENHQF